MSITNDQSEWSYNKEPMLQIGGKICQIAVLEST